MRRPTAVLATAFLVLTMVATPADAAVPVISTPDVSVPGKATGTVTTTAAFVRIDLYQGQYVVKGNPVQVVPGDTHQVAYSFNTWGLNNPSIVARECSALDTCSAEQTSVSFVPTDLAAAITWPSLTKVNPNETDYDVTVTDSGGGYLFAMWQTRLQSIARNTPQTIDFPYDGLGVLVIFRCNNAAGYFCRSLGVSPTLEVRRYLGLADEKLSRDKLSPNGDGLADSAVFSMVVNSGLPVDVAWRVTSNGVDTGVQGSLTNLVPNASKIVTFPVDPAGLPEGQFGLVVDVSSATDDFGEMAETLERGFTIDLTPPTGPLTLAATSATTFYPYPDRYHDRITFSVGAPGDNPAFLEVRSAATGSVVYQGHPEWFTTPSTYGWDGHATNGSLVPAGDYLARIVAADAAENRVVSNDVALVLRPERLVTRLFKKTVSAQRSLLDQNVGKCSTVKKGVRGWRGSLGIYTNTRCDGNFRESVTSTIHGLRLPAAYRYDTLHISVYGGAAKSRPGSYLFMDWLNNQDEWGDKDYRTGYKLGHYGPGGRAAKYFVYPDRWIVWGVYTYLGARWDVKSFTVTLKYTVLA
ncbi:MAG TPA: hypothetical protein VFK41_11750 [Nocardioidaceae bacterium]|nr:hypothetical protein [Nocardioidaceae bacterium]